MACGGVNANTLVRKLEWLCRGCRSASPSHETTIASFKADEGGNSSVAISDGLADRITVPLGVFGLSVDPVSAGDSGDYLCLVNNRRRPNAVVRLLVQGKPTLWRPGHGPQIASSREGRRGKFSSLEWRCGDGKESPRWITRAKTLGGPLITAVSERVFSLRASSSFDI